MTHLQIAKFRSARRRLSSNWPGWKSVSIFLVAAMLVGACEGSARKSGWFLGGKERRIIDESKGKESLRKSGWFIGGKERRIIDQSGGKDDKAAAKPAAGANLATAKSDMADQMNAPPTAITLENTDRAVATDRRPKEIDEVKGTGRFFNKRIGRKSVQISQGNGSVTLNFVDADVRDVINTVLGSTLGQNFAIDPKVKGTITLKTSKPIPHEAVLSTLESALKLNGIALIRSGDLYRVTTSSLANRFAARPYSAGMAGISGEAYGVEVMPLEFAAAAEMAKIIEPLAPSGAVIRTDAARNLLIVGGTLNERETIADIVSMFDVDWLSGMSFALIPLESAEPKETIIDLERVFGTANGGPLHGLVQFFPVERRRSILVISARASYIERARDWIKRLDVGGEDADKKRLYVYAVQNARAIDLAAILSQVFSGSSGSLPSSSVAPEQKQVRLTTSTSGAQGSTANTVSARAFGFPLSAAQASPAPASPAARSGAPLSGRLGGTPAIGAPTFAQRQVAAVGSLPEDLSARIIPDDVNNSLVVMARPAVWRMIKEALRKLDVVPLQVMIKATIAEVTLNDELRYGVQSFFETGSTSSTLSTLASGALSSTFPGFSVVYATKGIRGILDALDSVTDIRVISSPQILVLDNHTAEIQVGDQVPISIRQSTSNTDSTAPTVNSVEFRDTGVVLRVTPRVNANGLVHLEIEQEESSAVQTTSSGIDSPTIQQRKLRSTVVINSGETVALGGLIRDTQTDAVSGIPFLASIPIIGNLFSSTLEIGRRTELLVLITPTVIRNQEEARAVTRDLRKLLHNAAAIKSSR